MDVKKLKETVRKCERLQEQIKQGEENNLDEDVLIAWRKQYDYLFKLVINLEKELKDGKETNTL